MSGQSFSLNCRDSHRRQKNRPLTHSRRIGNHRIAIVIGMTIIPIDTGQRAAARSFEHPARRAAGRYRVTDSLAGVLFGPPFNFASFARLRAFLFRQCR